MYGAWEGADYAWELIWEEYQDLRYELDGPDSLPPDTRSDMKQDGTWEEAWGKWKEPDAERIVVLDAQISALWRAMKMCQNASNRFRKEYGKVTI